MMNVMGAIACDQNVRPTTWIRFNPNGFTADGVTCRVPLETKYRALLAAMTHVPLHHAQILYMFYDIVEGSPLICQDSAYDPVRNLLADGVW